jgi:hypothetical protein
MSSATGVHVEPTQYWFIVGFLLAGGGFSVLGAAMDWDFFMESRKARLFVSIFGRNGARIVYGVIGAALAAGGAIMLLVGPAALA